MRIVLPATVLLPLLLAAACAPDPIALGAGADPRLARSRLAERAAAGPVRLDINATPAMAGGTLTPSEIGEAAARGIRGLPVRFTSEPTAPATSRLVLLFDPVAPASPARICAADLLPPAAPAPDRQRLQAVFCDNGLPLADVTATAPGGAAPERLIWRTTARLFPDDYADTYGLNLFGSRVRVGVDGTFGF